MDSLGALLTKVLPLFPTAMQAVTDRADLIPSLLTGGGFVFLAAIVTGIFLYSKNATDGAKSLAEGATTLAEGAAADVERIRKDRDRISAKHDQLTKDHEGLRAWARRQRAANQEHSRWDADFLVKFRDLITHCETAGIIEPNSIQVDSPPSLYVPARAEDDFE